MDACTIPYHCYMKYVHGPYHDSLVELSQFVTLVNAILGVNLILTIMEDFSMSCKCLYVGGNEYTWQLKHREVLVRPCDLKVACLLREEAFYYCN